MSELADLIGELVAANHILYRRGVVDGFGHVSVRHPDQPERFLLARSMAPSLVTDADILTFDLDGAETTGDGRTAYLERFIHSEIYRVRPDVISVVHSHSPSVVPFSVVPSVSLRPIYHMCGFLGLHTPVFEIRDCAGDGTDMLVRDRALGAALARSLGNNAAVLMRGHGSTVVGANLRQAVYRAVYLEMNARLQGDAMRLGPVIFLSEAEAAAAAAANDGQIGRAWQLWRDECGQERRDF
jgi:HCOMODA/2-hydroxy-3-carboxy-muconic semialdehyde decarboxylase